jgi:hypothetical protein
MLVCSFLLRQDFLEPAAVLPLVLVLVLVLAREVRFQYRRLTRPVLVPLLPLVLVPRWIR